MAVYDFKPKDIVVERVGIHAPIIGVLIRCIRPT